MGAAARSLRLALGLLLLATLLRPADACSCSPVHPQQAFCNADVGKRLYPGSRGPPPCPCSRLGFSLCHPATERPKRTFSLPCPPPHTHTQRASLFFSPLSWKMLGDLKIPPKFRSSSGPRKGSQGTLWVLAGRLPGMPALGVGEWGTRGGAVAKGLGTPGRNSHR